MDMLKHEYVDAYKEWPDILLTDRAKSVSEGQACVGVCVTLDLIHPDKVMEKYRSGKYKCGELEGIDHVAFDGDITEICEVEGQLKFTVTKDNEGGTITFTESNIVEIDNYYITIYMGNM